MTVWEKIKRAQIDHEDPYELLQESKEPDFCDERTPSREDPMNVNFQVEVKKK